MRVGVIGVNHKLANLKLRDLLAKVCQDLFGLKHFPQQHHFVLLSTCNRTEIYFSSDNLTETHCYILSMLRKELDKDFDQHLYSFFRHDCFLHLSRVAAGLDSAIVAETEIQGQVKDAYQAALNAGRQLPKELHYLFQKALKNGKMVRQKLPINRGIHNVEHAIWEIGKQLFKPPLQSKILLVGTSEINYRVLRFLKRRGIPKITICNRTNQKAHEWAFKHSIQMLPWERFEEWKQYDWVILGTKSSNHLISVDQISRIPSKKLFFDLSVPRNLDPLIDYAPDCIVYNIDRIHQVLNRKQQKISHFIEKGEELILSATQLQNMRFLEKEQGIIPLHHPLKIVS